MSATSAVISDRSPVEAAVEGDNKTSAVEALRGYLARIAARLSVNAFTAVDAELALNAARQSDLRPAGASTVLRGVVLGVKDNIHVQGLTNSAGTTALKDFLPPDTSPVVAALQAAGAVVLGKTGLHELAYGITSNNFAYGPIRNPSDETKIPGGSSGGTAAAVAAGFVTAGLGTDTGGSVRLPAALTGTVGLRPTTGLYSNKAVTLISNTRDTLGVMAKTVKDVSILHAVITGRQRAVACPLKGLRVGVPVRHFQEQLDPEVAEVFGLFLERLQRAGIELVYADMTDVPELNEQVSFPICLYETTQLLPAYLERYGVGVSVDELIAKILSPDVAGVLSAAFSGAISPEAYDHALNEVRPKLRAKYAEYFKLNAVAAVVFPTSPITARNIDGVIDGVLVNGEKQDTFGAFIRNTDPASNAGIPGISLPAGTTKAGLCVGAEFECPEGQDETLLAIALAIEAAVSPVAL